ncbi:MAG: glycosyl hydrolase family 17 protein [Proteobacteria bacterium]|nr:glycosyl hydrolase family 17 protein [Pseudomonadota bacterium]
MNQDATLAYKSAICYSGFRDGQSPDTGLFPSKEQIASDLALLEGRWKALRLYACDLHSQRVLEVIDEQNLDFRVMLGAYIGAEQSNPECRWGAEYPSQVLKANKRRNQEEIARAAEWANRYPAIVDVVSAGNEATVDWTDHLVSVESVIDYVDFLKKHIEQPVTFCENYVPWLGKLDALVPHVDLIAIHTYPVWEYKTAQEALAYTQANYEAVSERHPDKQIIITEAGWATASDGRGIPPENVSEHYQQQYVRELLGWARDREILVYLFEAFDENWKGSNHPLEPEKHWGIYRADRQPKLVISP